MAATPPLITGLVARYVGPPGGATVRNYWVQALYPDGSRSAFSGPVGVTTPAALGGGFQSQSGIVNIGTGPYVALFWNPSPGAIAYDVVVTATTTYPSGQSNIGLVTGLTANSYADATAASPGNSPYLLYTPFNSTYLNIAFARYDFAVDGGAISTLTPASRSDSIPAFAVLVAGILKVTTAFTSGGAPTLSIGTTAGSSSSSIANAIALATLAANALIATASTYAAPVRMTAAGQINVTIAAATYTAGAIEIFVPYLLPSN